VVFSENRRSDDLVVYIGLRSDFDTDQLNPHYIFKSERRYHENAILLGTFSNKERLGHTLKHE